MNRQLDLFTDDIRPVITDWMVGMDNHPLSDYHFNCPGYNNGRAAIHQTDRYETVYCIKDDENIIDNMRLLLTFDEDKCHHTCRLRMMIKDDITGYSFKRAPYLRGHSNIPVFQFPFNIKDEEEKWFKAMIKRWRHNSMLGIPKDLLQDIGLRISRYIRERR